jgi:hypothetical protein
MWGIFGVAELLQASEDGLYCYLILCVQNIYGVLFYYLTNKHWLNALVSFYETF